VGHETVVVVGTLVAVLCIVVLCVVISFAVVDFTKILELNEAAVIGVVVAVVEVEGAVVVVDAVEVVAIGMKNVESTTRNS